uniref:DOT1 domain-containing protein n=1 Tax=Chromera velia CCMP2878 TaxID=1169474 RepID=A0A0G4H521_9ALVE|eukprot:Cvel_5715.t1-p1 / transcript=Cvel_5715.t1 / gene=Cvel_5715 / organism=Chromera_velia_CCMP2878 / gene_product=hypothetical protein / transcript_product=hypothetical protein / location=Cvel_scaffold270:79964-88923(-) / protein_length=844 / sequence_SO=supercontig / SO=protein_coding / is_pseudo=false
MTESKEKRRGILQQQDEEESATQGEKDSASSSSRKEEKKKSETEKEGEGLVFTSTWGEHWGWRLPRLPHVSSLGVCMIFCFLLSLGIHWRRRQTQQEGVETRLSASGTWHVLRQLGPLMRKKKGREEKEGSAGRGRGNSAEVDSESFGDFLDLSGASQGSSLASAVRFGMGRAIGFVSGPGALERECAAASEKISDFFLKGKQEQAGDTRSAGGKMQRQVPAIEVKRTDVSSTLLLSESSLHSVSVALSANICLSPAQLSDLSGWLAAALPMNALVVVPRPLETPAVGRDDVGQRRFLFPVRSVSVTAEWLPASTPLLLFVYRVENLEAPGRGVRYAREPVEFGEGWKPPPASAIGACPSSSSSASSALQSGWGGSSWSFLGEVVRPWTSQIMDMGSKLNFISSSSSTEAKQDDVGGSRIGSLSVFSVESWMKIRRDLVRKNAEWKREARAFLSNSSEVMEGIHKRQDSGGLAAASCREKMEAREAKIRKSLNDKRSCGESQRSRLWSSDEVVELFSWPETQLSPEDSLFELGSASGRLSLTAFGVFGVRQVVGVEVDECSHAVAMGALDSLKWMMGMSRMSGGTRTGIVEGCGEVCRRQAKSEDARLELRWGDFLSLSSTAAAAGVDEGTNLSGPVARGAGPAGNAADVLSGLETATVVVVHNGCFSEGGQERIQRLLTERLRPGVRVITEEPLDKPTRKPNSRNAKTKADSSDLDTKKIKKQKGEHVGGHSGFPTQHHEGVTTKEENTRRNPVGSLEVRLRMDREIRLSGTTHSSDVKEDNNVSSDDAGACFAQDPGKSCSANAAQTFEERPEKEVGTSKGERWDEMQQRFACVYITEEATS